MGELGINGWNLIIQLVAFGIFIFLLWRYALGPIVNVLDTRTDRVRESMEAAQRMQAELAQAQEEAAKEVVEASAGGGMVSVKANGAGEVVEIRIDAKAIDPGDPELLADMVLAAVNEALRSSRSLMESKMSGIVPGDLGGLGGLLPGS